MLGLDLQGFAVADAATPAQLLARLGPADQQRLDRALAAHKRIKAELSPKALTALDQLSAAIKQALTSEPHPDVLATATAVVRREAPGLSAAQTKTLVGYVLQDIEGDQSAEAAVVVILMMVQDGDQELQQQMEEAQSQMQAKQAVRGLVAQIQQDALGGMSAPSYGSATVTCTPPKVLVTLPYKPGKAGPFWKWVLPLASHEPAP